MTAKHLTSSSSAAGHNGLVTAAYLARAGRSVLVLEARELVGGCAVTEEIWPGYRVSTASYLSSLMQEKVVRDLELERFGYRVDAKDPAFFSPFPDGRICSCGRIARRRWPKSPNSPQRDAEAYPKYEDHLERLARGRRIAVAHHAAQFSALAASAISSTM